MAFYDWNCNGEDDMMDDFIEYNIYRQTTGKKEKDKDYYPSSGNGISTLGAILIMLSGLVIQAVFYAALDIDVDNIPGFVLVVLWILIDVFVVMLVEKLS